MIAGLPGMGLSGLFFILSALAMPFVQVARAARERTWRGWRTVATHVGIATGMVVAIDVAARLLRWTFSDPVSASDRGAAGASVVGVGDGMASFEVFGLPAFVVAIGSLLLLLVLSAVAGRLSCRFVSVQQPPVEQAAFPGDPVISSYS